MRYAGLLLLMLLVFWATNTWVLAYGIYWKWSDVQFAFALTVFFGTIVAVPLFAFLFAVDFGASFLPFPWNGLVYVVSVLLACAFFDVIIHFTKSQTWPASYEGWVVYLKAYLPIVTSGAVLLVYRMFNKPSPRPS